MEMNRIQIHFYEECFGSGSCKIRFSKQSLCCLFKYNAKYVYTVDKYKMASPE
jgi:hypothetical protein